MRRSVDCWWLAGAALPCMLAVSVGAVACELRIDASWIRLPPPGATTVAAYARISNPGRQSVDVVGIDTAIANMSHLHETQMDGSVAKMRAVNRLTVPSGGSIDLAPGGRHIMLLGVLQRLKPGDKVRINFTDSSRCTTTAEFTVLVKAPSYQPDP